MNVILSVYSKEAFKEYILPSLNNSDYAIVLSSDYFSLKDDFRLNLEVLDLQWRVRKDLSYQIKVGDTEYKDQVLKHRDVLYIKTKYNEEITIIVSCTETIFTCFRKFKLNNIQEISIGKAPGSDIRCSSRSMLSNKHARIVRAANGYKIVNSSPNGLYVDSAKVSDEEQLEFGSFINVLGLHMVFLGDLLAVDITGVAEISNRLTEASNLDEGTRFLNMKKSTKAAKTLYHRAPRSFENISGKTIEIETPPNLSNSKHQSLLMAIGPSATMALPMILGCFMMIYASGSDGRATGLYMYSGLVMAVSSALIGVIWALVSIRQQKKEDRLEKEHRFAAYSEYLVEKANEVKESYQETESKLHENYPSAENCLKYDESKGMLWSRNRTHSDFLQHRLGLGDIPFTTEISVPKKKFTLVYDELAEKPAKIKESYSTLFDVPVLVNLLEQNLIGVIGGEKKTGAIDVAKILSAQLASNTCYTDVKLAYIYDGDSSINESKWEFAKWLPHVWSNDKKTRFVASSKEEASDVLYELTKILRERSERDNKEKSIPKPYYVVFISDVNLLDGELFSKYVFGKENSYGMTTVILAERYEELPNSCDFVIENTDAFKGMYNVYSDHKERQEIKFDSIDDALLERFARHLSTLQVVEIEEGGDIPNSVNFLEMLGVSTPEELPVRELWAKNRTYDNIKGMIGKKAGDSPCFLDVHEKYHGPHGLVAGTTGSGKSETLQTYMLSLAVNYSPDDIGFFVIDYKGGGMANLFEGLPHLIGQISNLSGNQVKRAMISIKSENRRRQRVFSENGVNNINAYTKLYKNGEATLPVPHLFIIIDEFAELRREEPDFMKELISVAQVGRSLGVHLILATQKPSGNIDENILSNSKFRLCLRVQTQQDSKDMLGKPDAAFITQAGRCFLQVGNDEVYELFQSGYSGAAFDKHFLSSDTEIAKLIDNTGKIEITGSSMKLSRKKHSDILWIDSLIDCLETTLEKYRLSLLACLDSDAKMQKLVAGMFDWMENKEIDYPKSKFNAVRLTDFVGLYAEALQSSDSRTLSETILSISQKTEKKLPQSKEKTQLDAVKDYLGKVAVENGYNHKLSLWMPVISDHIYLEEFDEFIDNTFSGTDWKEKTEWNLSFVLGKIDDPENQSQLPMVMDLASDGNIAVLGGIVCGKSTMLQTMAYSLIMSYSPAQINIYAIDFSSKMMSAFEDAPHFGGVMYENDEDKIDKFINMMDDILIQRKEKFRGGNYRQYVQVHGVDLPSIVIFIDNYASFKEKTEEKYEDQLIRLSKEGISHGVFLIISGAGYGLNDITTRVGENLNTVLCLSMQDRFAYGEYLHNMQIDVLPEVGIKGRGLASFDGRILEYQTALAIKAENDYERMEKIRGICRRMSAAWTGRPARRIPEIPQKPVWSLFSETEEYERELNKGNTVPVGYNESDASVYSVPLNSFYCYTICGKPKTGKTNYMRVFLQSVLKTDAEVCVIDSPRADFASYRNMTQLTYADNEEAVFEFFKGVLVVFKERNALKNQMLAEDADDDEIFAEMSKKKPIFIFIPDFSWFIDFVYQAQSDMKGFLANVIGKGRLHHIYFIAEIDLAKRSRMLGYEIYEHFVSYKTGIHFGGNVADEPILSFESLPYAEQLKPEPASVGMLPPASGQKEAKKVVVPLARR